MSILVTGATGNVGRHVVRGLVDAGASVRVVTRNPERAHFPAGVQVLRGDLAKPDTLRAAFDGVSGLYLFPLAHLTPEVRSFADIVVNTDVPEQARAAGVGHIVLLSSNAVLHGADAHHREAEAAVLASGVRHTFLRPGEFMMNKLAAWGASIRDAGVVRSGFPHVVGVPVHEADVAAVAVKALLEDGHDGAGHVMTGPQALTEREQVAEIAAGLGREIRFEELTPEQARADWIAQGLPEEVVDEMMSHSGKYDAEPPAVVDTVGELTGTPARTLRTWAADHAADFA